MLHAGVRMFLGFSSGVKETQGFVVKGLGFWVLGLGFRAALLGSSCYSLAQAIDWMLEAMSPGTATLAKPNAKDQGNH